MLEHLKVIRDVFKLGEENWDFYFPRTLPDKDESSVHRNWQAYESPITIACKHQAHELLNVYLTTFLFIE